MSRLSMVFQDVYLFDDSLIANIRVGRPDASGTLAPKCADLQVYPLVTPVRIPGFDKYIGQSVAGFPMPP